MPSPTPPDVAQGRASRRLVAARLGVALLWVLGMTAMATWSYTDGALLGAALLTVIAAAVTGPWWPLLAPLLPAAVLVVGSLVQGGESDADGVTGYVWAGYIAAVAGIYLALVAVGVAIHSLAWHLRRASDERR